MIMIQTQYICSEELRVLTELGYVELRLIFDRIVEAEKIGLAFGKGNQIQFYGFGCYLTSDSITQSLFCYDIPHDTDISATLVRTREKVPHNHGTGARITPIWQRPDVYLGILSPSESATTGCVLLPNAPLVKIVGACQNLPVLSLIGFNLLRKQIAQVDAANYLNYQIVENPLDHIIAMAEQKIE